MSAEDYAVLCFPAWYKVRETERIGKTEDEVIEMFADYWCSLGQEGAL